MTYTPKHLVRDTLIAVGLDEDYVVGLSDDQLDALTPFAERVIDQDLPEFDFEEAFAEDDFDPDADDDALAESIPDIDGDPLPRFNRDAVMPVREGRPMLPMDEVNREALILTAKLGGLMDFEAIAHEDDIPLARELFWAISYGDPYPAWVDEFAKAVGEQPLLNASLAAMFRHEARRSAKEYMSQTWDLVEGFSDEVPDLRPIVGDRDVTLVSGSGMTFVFGNDGAGKTTFVGNVAKAAMGAVEDVIGFPVNPIPEEKHILVALVDRPQEAKANFARTGLAGHPRVHVYAGPLPLQESPVRSFSDFVRSACEARGLTLDDLGLVILDNAQTVWGNISEANRGGMAQQALNLVDSKVPVVVVAQTNKHGEPTSRTDAGASGNFLGHAAAQVSFWRPENWPRSHTRMRAFKPPQEVKPFWEVEMDLETGMMAERRARADDFEDVAPSGKFTAKDLAARAYETDDPTDTQVKEARKYLDKSDAYERLDEKRGRSNLYRRTA